MRSGQDGLGRRDWHLSVARSSSGSSRCATWKRLLSIARVVPIEAGMSRRTWDGYLAVAAAAVAGYLLTPNDSWAQTIYAELVGLFATGAIVVGVAKHRPAAKAAWLWFAAGQLLRPGLRPPTCCGWACIHAWSSGYCF